MTSEQLAKAVAHVIKSVEKRILGIGPKTDMWNTYDCDSEVKSDNYDSGSYINETIRYDKEYITDEDYRFE